MIVVLGLGCCWKWARDGVAALLKLRVVLKERAGLDVNLVLEVFLVLELGLFWRLASDGG